MYITKIMRGGGKKIIYSVRKITDFYIGYWCVFIPLFILAVALKSETFSFCNFLMQLFGVNSNTMLFAWYVPFFVFSMIVLPIINKCGNYNYIIFIGTTFVAIKFFSQIIIWSTDVSWVKNVMCDFQATFPLVIIGYCFSNWRIFCKFQSAIKINKKIVLILIMSLIIILTFLSKRHHISFKFGEMYFKDGIIDISYSIDIISVPLFIWAIVNIIHMIGFNRLILKIFEEIGKKSMMMWFVSCAFFSNLSQKLQPFLYWPHNPVLVVLWGCLLCYIISIFFNILSKNLCKFKNKLFKQILNRYMDTTI